MNEHLKKQQIENAPEPSAKLQHVEGATVQGVPVGSSVLQWVAVCVAVRCSVLQCVAVCCCELQCVAA